MAKKKQRTPEQQRRHDYYMRNREMIIARSKQWQKDNPEKARECEARWRKNNPDKCEMKNAKSRAARKAKREKAWAKFVRLLVKEVNNG